MLEWVRRAAARLDLFAGRGPLEALAAAGQQDALRRQSLVALAREEDWAVSEQELSLLSIQQAAGEVGWRERQKAGTMRDRKSTRLNSSHVRISYAVFCLKKKTSLPRRIERPRLVQELRPAARLRLFAATARRCRAR